MIRPPFQFPRYQPNWASMERTWHTVYVRSCNPDHPEDPLSSARHNKTPPEVMPLRVWQQKGNIHKIGHNVLHFNVMTDECLMHRNNFRGSFFYTILFSDYNHSDCVCRWSCSRLRLTCVCWVSYLSEYYVKFLFLWISQFFSYF